MKLAKRSLIFAVIAVIVHLRSKLTFDLFLGGVFDLLLGGAQLGPAMTTLASGLHLLLSISAGLVVAFFPVSALTGLFFTLLLPVWIFVAIAWILINLVYVSVWLIGWTIWGMIRLLSFLGKVLIGVFLPFGSYIAVYVAAAYGLPRFADRIAGVTGASIGIIVLLAIIISTARGGFNLAKRTSKQLSDMIDRGANAALEAYTSLMVKLPLFTEGDIHISGWTDTDHCYAYQGDPPSRLLVDTYDATILKALGVNIHLGRGPYLVTQWRGKTETVGRQTSLIGISTPEYKTRWTDYTVTHVRFEDTYIIDRSAAFDVYTTPPKKLMIRESLGVPLPHRGLRAGDEVSMRVVYSFTQFGLTGFFEVVARGTYAGVRAARALRLASALELALEWIKRFGHSMGGDVVALPRVLHLLRQIHDRTPIRGKHVFWAVVATIVILWLLCRGSTFINL